MLIDHVSRTVKRFEMIRPGDRVLVAASGGPDSVALAHALYELRRRLHIELALAHLNHQLRPESDEDEAFCRQLARQLQVPFLSERADVAGEARRGRRSVEEQGRLSRYLFLEKAARELACNRIAVGHTRDDQAETFILRLLRGAGSSGLAAIYPVVDGHLIRPLIEVSRLEVLEFLSERRLECRLDSSNADWSIPRNRVRHEALPYLETHFNPRLVETLARTADLLREDEDWLEREAESILETLTLELHEERSTPGDRAGERSERSSDRPPHHESAGTGRLVRIPAPTKGPRAEARSGADPRRPEKTVLRIRVEPLSVLHPALKRRVVRRAIERVKGDLRSIGAVHVDEVLKLAWPGKSGRQLCLPGVKVDRSFEEISFRRAGGGGRARSGSPNTTGGRKEKEGAGEGGPGYRYDLQIPGRVEIPEAGGLIAVEEWPGRCAPAAAGCSVVIGMDDERASLIVRSPRRGDRFHPLGAPGPKPLARYLMERRVERERRRRVPVVARGDKILWVAGHAVSELSRIEPGARRVLQLRWFPR